MPEDKVDAGKRNGGPDAADSKIRKARATGAFIDCADQVRPIRCINTLVSMGIKCAAAGAKLDKQQVLSQRTLNAESLLSNLKSLYTLPVLRGE